MMVLVWMILLAAAFIGCDRGPLTGPQAPPENGFRLSFNEQGDLLVQDKAKLEAILAASNNATDLFIFSHGWWNNSETAECRYTQFIAALRKRKPNSLSPEVFRPVMVGIYWPSAIFPLEKVDCGSTPADPSSVPLESGTSADLSQSIETWAREAFPTAAARAEFPSEVAQVAQLLGRERRGDRLTPHEGETLAALLMRWRDAGRPVSGATISDGPGELGFEGPPQDVAGRWSRRLPKGEDSPTEAFGSAQWLDFANVFTFWTMKDRAGIVGTSGVYEVLRTFQDARKRGLRIHLIGHSFGGKLLSAAITGRSGGIGNTVDSFVIFQGAFSHFAFSNIEQIRKLGVTSDRDGLYVDIVARQHVVGPIIATFSKQDRANQLWYPRGVALSDDFLEAGGVTRYGSIGADGIQGPSVQRMSLATDRLLGRLKTDMPRLFNIDATNVIRGHSDLIKDQTVDLLWDLVISYTDR